MASPQLVQAYAPDNTPIVSVLVGRCYTYTREGICRDLGSFEFTEEPQLYQGLEFPGRTKPALVQRDFDVWGWKDGTDLVVQGVARVERPTRTLAVELRCDGHTPFSQRILVSGDRWVEGRPGNLRLGDPAPFSEMPMRWDKAYGGVDEKAEERLLGEYRQLLERLMEQPALDRWSECAYPRNPAGKGFIVDERDAVGLAWPNLELAGEALTLANLAAPLAAWGQRPYPACWDFLPYHWFPRCVGFFDPIDTDDGRMPRREVELGLVPDTPVLLQAAERPWPVLARVAHPLLWNYRLRGSERISINAMGPEGEDARIILPDAPPTIHLRLEGGRRKALPPVLDLVFVETEARRVTLIWRASLQPAPDALPPDWEERAEVNVDW